MTQARADRYEADAACWELYADYFAAGRDRGLDPDGIGEQRYREQAAGARADAARLRTEAKEGS